MDEETIFSVFLEQTTQFNFISTEVIVAVSVRDFFGLFLLAAGWGPTFLLIKLGVERVSPLVLTTTRVFTAAIFLYLYCLLTGRELRSILSYWKGFLFMAVVGNAIPFTFCAWAETMVQSSTAGIIEASVPIITSVLTVLFTSQNRLPKEQIGGIILGFVGILILFSPDLLSLESSTDERFLGKVLLMIMSLCFASAFVYSKEHLEQLPHIAGVTLQMVLATSVLAPITIAFEGWGAFGTLTVESFLVATVLGVAGTAFPWCVYFYLIKRGSAAQVSLAIYLLPVVAIFLGWVFLGETLRWNLALGTAVILFSLLLAGGMLSRKRLSEHDNPILRS